MTMKEHPMRMTIAQTDAPLTLRLNMATVIAVVVVVAALCAAPLLRNAAPQAQGVPVTQD